MNVGANQFEDIREADAGEDEDNWVEVFPRFTENVGKI